MPRNLFQSAAELIPIVPDELEQLRAAGMKPTAGDIRCIAYGHAVRMAIWNLREKWQPETATKEKLTRFADALLPSAISIPSSRNCARRHSKSPSSRHLQWLLSKKSKGAAMPFPFERPFEEVQANIDRCVDEVFAALETGFLTMPKGPGFIEYETFEHGYQELKRTTQGFRDLSLPAVLQTVHQTPIALIVLRAMLGFTPSEWAAVATARTEVEVTQGAARSIDRKIRISPETPLHEDGITGTACHRPC